VGYKFTIPTVGRRLWWEDIDDVRSAILERYAVASLSGAIDGWEDPPEVPEPSEISRLWVETINGFRACVELLIPRFYVSVTGSPLKHYTSAPHNTWDKWTLGYALDAVRGVAFGTSTTWFRLPSPLTEGDLEPGDPPLVDHITELRRVLNYLTICDLAALSQSASAYKQGFSSAPSGDWPPASLSWKGASGASGVSARVALSIQSDNFQPPWSLNWNNQDRGMETRGALVANIPDLSACPTPATVYAGIDVDPAAPADGLMDGQDVASFRVSLYRGADAPAAWDYGTLCLSNGLSSGAGGWQPGIMATATWAAAGLTADADNYFQVRAENYLGAYKPYDDSLNDNPRIVDLECAATTPLIAAWNMAYKD
jgi:hypothetical protein